jgi:hypothetical protein
MLDKESYVRFVQEQYKNDLRNMEKYVKLS